MGGGASTANPEPTTYYAKVPPDGKPGDVISADVNGRPVKVRVPAGSSAGQLFRFSAADCIATPSAPTSSAPTSGLPSQAQGPGSATRPPVPTPGPVLAAYNNNPQPGMNYTTNPNNVGKPVQAPGPISAVQLGQQAYSQQPHPQSQPQPQPQLQQQFQQQLQRQPQSSPALSGAQMVQQIYAPAQQQPQPSTANMSGAQIVQQFGYHQQQQQQQQPQPQMMMMPVNTPFPQQHFQQQPHYMMVPQQHQMVAPQQQQMMMPQQQMMMAPQQQYLMPQQYAFQQHPGQPQYAPQMYVAQHPSQLPVATPI